MTSLVAVYFRGSDRRTHRISAPSGAAGPRGLVGSEGPTGPTGPPGPVAGGDVPGTEGYVLTSNGDGTATWQAGVGWDTYDLKPIIHSEWVTNDAEVIPGIYSNKYICLLTMLIYSGTLIVEGSYVPVIAANAIPANLRPPYKMWDVKVATGEGTASTQTSSSFEIYFEPDGELWIKMAGWTHDWSWDSQIPISFTYPKSS